MQGKHLFWQGVCEKFGKYTSVCFVMIMSPCRVLLVMVMTFEEILVTPNVSLSYHIKSYEVNEDHEV